jgi:archaellin
MAGQQKTQGVTMSVKSIRSTHRMPHRNTNESRTYKIAHATKWSKGKAGLEVRCRLIVMVYNQKDHFGKYAVRWQNYNGATWGGASFNSLEQANGVFMKRYKEHNADFKKGNVSHLPGNVK